VRQRARAAAIVFDVMPVIVGFGPLLVGLVLAFAGLAKALEPDYFVRHLKNLGLLPKALQLPAALAVISFQGGLGVALLLRLWPARVLPFAILSLLGLGMIGYWSTATGRTADCGCYNGLFTFSPLQSLVLDTVYAVLLGLSWWRGVPGAEPASWKIAMVLFAAAGGGGLALGLFLYSERHGIPLVELTPIRVGRRWNPSWLPRIADLSADDGVETLIVFLGANCAHCMRWIKVLNTIHACSKLPEVRGVVAISPDQLSEYLDRAAVRFPIVAVSTWVAARLSRSITPTAVLIQEGVIREKWIRSMPKPFLERVRAEVPRAAAPVPG
jgi:hypothetical protein